MKFKNGSVSDKPPYTWDRQLVCENCGEKYGGHYGLRCPHEVKPQRTPLAFNPMNGEDLPKDTLFFAERVRQDRPALKLGGPQYEWRFDPWTGGARDARDIKSDPYGLLIVPPGENIASFTDVRGRIEPITHAKKAAIHAALYPGVTVPSADSLPAFYTTPGAVPPVGEAASFTHKLYSDEGGGPGWPQLTAKWQPPADTTPYRESVSYIGEAPVGAKLMAFGDKVFMVATGMAPHWVTPTGLVLMQRADGGEN